MPGIFSSAHHSYLKVHRGFEYLLKFFHLELLRMFYLSRLCDDDFIKADELHEVGANFTGK